MSARVAVCLHGFLRTSLSMRPVARRLEGEGYDQVDSPTLMYPTAPYEVHVDAVADRIRELSDRHDGARVDMVTHSFGGLVARGVLSRDAPVRRVVMLAPPNQGAELANVVRRWLPVHRAGWDPLAPLLPGAPPTRHELPDGVDIGIVTGGTGDDRGFRRWLRGDNDGKVRVEEAILPGAGEFRVVPYGHTFVMARREVLDLVVRFLKTGRF